MDGLKEFLDKLYNNYELLEDDTGTYLILEDDRKIPLYFERNKVSLGSYFDTDEGCVLDVLIDRD